MTLMSTEITNNDKMTILIKMIMKPVIIIMLVVMTMINMFINR